MFQTFYFDHKYVKNQRQDLECVHNNDDSGDDNDDDKKE